MPTAYIHLRSDPHYRLDAFTQGFTRLGFHVEHHPPYSPMNEGDVAVIWNKTARSLGALKNAGDGAVIVAENGYYGEERYALALDGHNGSGRWYVGDRPRLDALQIDFQPLVSPQTGKVVIAGQRGIGSPAMRSPGYHAQQIEASLINRGYRPLVRPHPGRHAPTSTLAEDLEGAEALVVWSSNCATEGLIRGIPVYFDAPHIVTEPAAIPWFKFGAGVVAPTRTEEMRQAAFLRLAWAQWSVDEIRHGAPFQVLLDVQAGVLPSCQKGLGL